MTCMYCQAPIGWGVKFCSHCGMRPGELAKLQVEAAREQLKHHKKMDAPLGCANFIVFGIAMAVLIPILFSIHC